VDAHHILFTLEKGKERGGKKGGREED